ncbi:hypothetical protein GQR58_010153 [Nymphon striatum]|nr:hypothetical protein GQR58_010153 [Nymphon striatum]
MCWYLGAQPDSSLGCLSLCRSSRMKEAVQSYVMRGICIQRRTLLRPEWTTTGGADAQQFLIHDSGVDAHNRMLVFGTEQGLQHLCRSNMWFMDGTFSTASRLFKQLYRICPPLGNSFVTCSYAFLSGKSQDDYDELLQFHSIVRKYPLTVVTDFELAAIWAVETTFGPHVRCQRCFCHLTQSTWRNIQELGLVELYKTNEDVKLYCGMLDGLGFLPEDEVVRGMDYLKESAPEELTDLLTYFDSVVDLSSSRNHTTMAQGKMKVKAKLPSSVKKRAKGKASVLKKGMMKCVSTCLDIILNTNLYSRLVSRRA